MLDWLASKIFGKTLPPDDLIKWYFKVYDWLLKHDGGIDALKRRPLVLPLDKNFPLTQSSGELLAAEVFRHVKSRTVPDCLCRLEPQDPDVDPRQNMGLMMGAYNTTGANGTFRMDSDGACISYDPELLSDIPTLIATFAHEMGHYFHTTMAYEAPGGADAYEPATDLTAIYFGFGIFIANAALRMKHSSDYQSTRWSATTSGYLGEPSRAYCLAIFTELHGYDPKDASAHLKTNVKSYYRAAIDDLRNRWVLDMQLLRGL
jgi:hypothetical protein